MIHAAVIYQMSRSVQLRQIRTRVAVPSRLPALLRAHNLSYRLLAARITPMACFETSGRQSSCGHGRLGGKQCGKRKFNRQARL